MDYYIKGAVEEYLKHNRTILEGLRDQGVFSQEDVERELENIKAKIEKDIETNKAYAMLLMEIEKDKFENSYNYLKYEVVINWHNLQNNLIKNRKMSINVILYNRGGRVE